MPLMQPRIRQNLGSALTDRAASPNIWYDCPEEAIRYGDVDGAFIDDDFCDFLLPGTQTSEINLGRYKVYNTGSGKVITDSMPHGTAAAQNGGIISMLCDTAGDQSVIGTHACPFYLTTTGSPKLWFEARVALTAITTNMSQMFIGLGNNAEVTFGAAIPLADADATGTAVNLFGFNRLEDGLGVLNTAYTDEAAVWTNVQAAAGAIAAETFVKLGFRFDPRYVDGGTSKAVRFYVNNVECTTALTKATLLALTNLDVSGLGPVFAAFADSGGTACYHYLDWWKCYQTF